MKKIINNGEIDLIRVINTIWNNKSQILGITLIFCLLTLSSYKISPLKFKVTTEIKPISIFEEQPYNYFNYLIDKKNFIKLISQLYQRCLSKKFKIKNFL